MKTMPGLEIDESQTGGYPVLKPGTYSFSVVDAEEQTSNAGNQMLKVELSIYEPSTGKTRKAWDYLVSTEGMEWKVRHFAKSCSLFSVYESGEMTPHDIVGATGTCIIKNEMYQGSQQHKVEDYVTDEDAKPIQNDLPNSLPGISNGSKHQPVDDSSIPF